MQAHTVFSYKRFTKVKYKIEVHILGCSNRLPEETSNILEEILLFIFRMNMKI